MEIWWWNVIERNGEEFNSIKVMRIRGAGGGVALLSWKYKMQNTPYDWKIILIKTGLFFFMPNITSWEFLKLNMLKFTQTHISMI